VGGWYDIFLPAQVADFERLVAAGREARLTVGPWTHSSLPGMAAIVRDGLQWFDVHLLGRRAPTRKPVRLFVMGARRWMEVDRWPPPADLQRWHLHTGGRLDPATPGASPPDRYRYDPADPTPSAGGASLDRRAGRKDQRIRETRADVLSYTSEPLPSDLTVAGPVAVDVHLGSSHDHTDYVVRLCDVAPRGRSVNLSDGIVRLRPGSVERSEQGTFRLRIPMWPTANTFRAGHRIRLQVSSGAHPLFARNAGNGDPIATATTLTPVDHEVFHDPDRPSAIELPVARR
jgi:putative CocE/NonD family hydrolase